MTSWVLFGCLWWSTVVGPMTFQDAELYCYQAGGRLPHLDEMVDVLNAGGCTSWAVSVDQSVYTWPYSYDFITSECAEPVDDGVRRYGQWPTELGDDGGAFWTDQPTWPRVHVAVSMASGLIGPAPDISDDIKTRCVRDAK